MRFFEMKLTRASLRIGRRACHGSPRVSFLKRRAQSRSCRSPPLWGRCPAGQRGALSRRPVNECGSSEDRHSGTDCERWRSFAPPSVLPDISPTRGEIGCHACFRQ